MKLNSSAFILLSPRNATMIFIIYVIFNYLCFTWNIIYFIKRELNQYFKERETKVKKIFHTKKLNIVKNEVYFIDFQNSAWCCLRDDNHTPDPVAFGEPFGVQRRGGSGRGQMGHERRGRGAASSGQSLFKTVPKPNR
jgi:hypothetical protein